MSYIDVLIPFIVGCLFALRPHSLVKPTAASYERKVDTLRKCGIALIGISALYFAITVFS